jgi:hypothetical protein
MAQITSRQGLIEYCLRKLGHPVTEINVDVDQIEDRVDEALEFYADYHFDAKEKTYYLHTLTATDLTNKYIPIPDSMIFVTNVMTSNALTSWMHPMGDPSLSWRTGLNPFNKISQLPATSSANDHAGEGGFNMQSYFIAMQNIAEITDMLGNSHVPIRFNRHTNKLYLDMDWEMNLTEGSVLAVEGWARLDPEEYNEVYNDRWLKRYLTALLKQQYGTNLSKFGGIALPGGVTLDGDKIYEQATEELRMLEEEMQEKYELPPMPFMG